MKRDLRWLVAGMTLVCGALAPASGAAEPRLVVRVNDQAHFDQAEIAKAEAIVSTIFHEFGIQVEWQDAANLGVVVHDGPKKLIEKPDVLINILSVKPATMRGHGDEAGMAAVPEGSRQDLLLCWVFRPTLERIVDDTQYLTPNRQRSVLSSVLLGHVMAHEMGHLLLGSAKHSETGLMTLGWDLGKLRLACSDRLRFSPQQSDRIRASVQAKTDSGYHASASQPAR